MLKISKSHINHVTCIWFRAASLDNPTEAGWLFPILELKRNGSQVLELSEKRPIALFCFGITLTSPCQLAWAATPAAAQVLGSRRTGSSGMGRLRDSAAVPLLGKRFVPPVAATRGTRVTPATPPCRGPGTPPRSRSLFWSWSRALPLSRSLLRTHSLSRSLSRSLSLSPSRSLSLSRP